MQSVARCLRQKTAAWFDQGLASWANEEGIGIDAIPYQVEWTRSLDHGHVAINAAMLAAKVVKKAPRACAEALLAHLSQPDWVAHIALAGPGFINITFSDAALHAWLLDALDQGFETLFASTPAWRIHLEYVSANPTGPLHVGHGRAAAYGSSLAALLRRGGADVHEAYYVNDAGRQIRLLGLSTVLRALEVMGHALQFPTNCYQGDYIHPIAKAFLVDHEAALIQLASQPGFEAFLLGSEAEDDADQRLSWFEASASDLSARIAAFASDAICENIKEDLAQFRVKQQWFSEASLLDDDVPGAVLRQLEARGHTYEQEGALWFRSTAFGDEKDRVLRRSDGRLTYFAMDAAYHWHKFEQGFDQVIDVFGADHHGYVARIQGVIKALGHDTSGFHCPLVQFAILYRDGEKLAMSTRSGEFVTLHDLQEEVGVDAARFFYLMRKMDQHVDFDLSLAKAESQDNPVYYLQYAYARIQSVFSQPLAKSTALPASQSALSALDSKAACELLRHLVRYPDVLRQCIAQTEVHGLCHYLRELAASLHAYYNQEPCLVEDTTIRQARLTLLQAVALVLNDGANLLGLTLPNRM